MHEYMEFQPKNPAPVLHENDWPSLRSCYIWKDQGEFLNDFHDFEVRDDDVWIVTLPKSGTTWMQELVWLVLNDYNFEYAKQQPLEFRSRFAEFPQYLGIPGSEAFKELDKAPSPRFIKSHLPWMLLPRQVWTKKPKIIYVFRNPKDAAVSGYYFLQNFGLNLDKNLEAVIDEELNCVEQTTMHWNHVLEFYAMRNESWLHYTSFENLKKDLRKEILDVCKFLNRSITDEQMERMLKHLSFEEMKNNPQCHHLYEIEVIRKHQNIKGRDQICMRKGKVDGYKDELSAELVAKFDKWIEDNLKPYKVDLKDLLVLT